MERKYYRDGRYYIHYQQGHCGFFTSIPDKYCYFLFYEEDGKFYELLTGKCLGVKKSDGNTPYVFSNEFGYSIPLSGYSYRRYAHEVTAETFASEARQYMNDRNQIIPFIHDKLDEWKYAYKKRLEKEKKERVAEERKKIEDKNNVDWLSELLYGRK